MTGAAGIAALVLLSWAAGTVGASTWTQSWNVVKRGHFRITAWTVLAVGGLGLWAVRASEVSAVWPWGVGFVVASAVYVLVQYSRTDVPGVVVGTIAAAAGAVVLVVAGETIPSWTPVVAGAELLSGALLLGAVTNGMLLGHWYLNQPGLKPWALGRLSDLCLSGVVASGLMGLVAAGKLASAETTGAVLGLRGFGESFGVFFYVIWIALIVFTGIVCWMARRCVAIRSIQSATGLFYVAILTAGVAAFMLCYLMVNAT